ncbi:MAG: D-alanine--D-alanine ligase [Cyanobacteria bacterium P01_C01_bin.69]
MSCLRILHLVGSPTDQFYCDLSKLYAQGCIDALSDAEKYEFVIAYVTPDGVWRFVRSLQPADIATAAPLTLSKAVQVLAEQNIDAAVPQMFCAAGMTDYRALLNSLKIPYIGNDPFLMALTANKAKTKAIVAAAGVAVPQGELLTPGRQPSIKLPAVVKPNSADNSDGVSFVKTQEDYAIALEKAFSYEETVVVEEFVELGREVRCGVVVENGELRCLPLEEYLVKPGLRPIRDKAHKLKRDQNNVLTMTSKGNAQSWIVDIDDPIVADVWEAAKQCHRALGCQQYSLFDFRIDPNNKPWFIEAGLYCSFSPKSVLVTMMEAAETPLVDFFESALRQVIVNT